MNLKVIEEAKGKFVFELDEGHAFCNSLKDELYNDGHIKTATYRRDHPLINISRFQIETDGKLDGRAAIQKAIQRLTVKNKNMRQQFAKSLK